MRLQSMIEMFCMCDAHSGHFRSTSFDMSFSRKSQSNRLFMQGVTDTGYVTTHRTRPQSGTELSRMRSVK